MRLLSYGLPLSASAQQYVETMRQHAAVQQWMDAALQEQAWVNYLEPYRQVKTPKDQS